MTTIYDGKYCNTICDSAVKAGEAYTYTVCPKYRGNSGKSVTLPEIRIPKAGAPEDWWE